jgi:hypothetical protein
MKEEIMQQLTLSLNKTDVKNLILKYQTSKLYDRAQKILDEIPRIVENAIKNGEKKVDIYRVPSSDLHLCHSSRITDLIGVSKIVADKCKENGLDLRMRRTIGRSLDIHILYLEF